MNYSVKLRRLCFYEHISFTHSFAVPANVKVATCEKQKIYFSSPLLHGQWPLNWFLSFLSLLWHLNHALLLKPGRTFAQMLADISTKRISFANVALVVVSVFPVRNILYRGERIFTIKHCCLTRTVALKFYSCHHHIAPWCIYINIQLICATGVQVYWLFMLECLQTWFIWSEFIMHYLFESFVAKFYLIWSSYARLIILLLGVIFYFNLYPRSKFKRK